MKGFKQGAQTGAGVVSHGAAMGFKKGGMVKVKDTGNMPAKPDGDSQQEKEAGGRPLVRPGYKTGGKAVAKGAKKAAKGISKHSKKQGEAVKAVGRGMKRTKRIAKSHGKK